MKRMDALCKALVHDASLGLSAGSLHAVKRYDQSGRHRFEQ